jgi:hypothetical protein
VEFATRSIVVDDKTIKAQIWDTGECKPAIWGYEELAVCEINITKTCYCDSAHRCIEVLIGPLHVDSVLPNASLTPCFPTCFLHIYSVFYAFV